MGKKDTVYVLFKFSDTQFLGVGTTESIVLPEEFATKKLTQQLLDIRSFISKKTEIGVNWPVQAVGGFTEPAWSLPSQRSSLVSYNILQAEILSFTEDKETIAANMDAILDLRKKPKPKVTNSYRSIPASKQNSGRNRTSGNILTDKDLNVPGKHVVAKKSVPEKGRAVSVPVVDSEDDILDDSDADMFADDDADPPSQPSDSPSLTSAEGNFEKVNETTPTRAASLSTPAGTPPSLKESAVDKRSRKQLYEPTTPLMNRQIQGDRSAEIIDKTSSSTEGPSFSKQRKLDEINALKRKLEETQMALDEDSQDGYIDEQQLSRLSRTELLDLVKKLRKEHVENHLNFEHEREQFNEELKQNKVEYNSALLEKDAIIQELQDQILKYQSEDNPAHLLQSLQESVKTLKEMIANGNSKSLGVHQGGQQQQSSSVQVKIDDGYETVVSKTVLRNAVSFGKCGKQTSPHLNKMVSTLMKGIWDREFMASHSVSGRKCPTDKSGKPPKPALPADPVNAIKSFSVNFWKTQHGMDISPSTVVAAISAKLLSEHSAMLKGDLDEDGDE